VVLYVDCSVSEKHAESLFRTAQPGTLVSTYKSLQSYYHHSFISCSRCIMCIFFRMWLKTAQWKQKPRLSLGLRSARSPDCTRRTYFCGDLSNTECIRVTHEAWRNWYKTLNRVLSTFIQKQLYGRSIHIKKSGCLSSRKWLTFSTYVVKLLYTFFLKKSKVKNNLVCLVI
jgi:hypothetical protein